MTQATLDFLPTASEAEIWEGYIVSTKKAVLDLLPKIKKYEEWVKVRMDSDKDRFDTAFRIATTKSGLATKLGDKLKTLKSFVGKRIKARGYFLDKKERKDPKKTVAFSTVSEGDFLARFAEADQADGRVLVRSSV